MKRSAMLVLLLTTATVCAGPSGEPPRAPVSSPLEIADLEAELATLIPPLLEKFNVPGASVAVVVDREVVLLRGFGRLSSAANAPAVDAHSVFQAAGRAVRSRRSAPATDHGSCGPVSHDRVSQLAPRQLVRRSEAAPNQVRTRRAVPLLGRRLRLPAACRGTDHGRNAGRLPAPDGARSARHAQQLLRLGRALRVRPRRAARRQGTTAGEVAPRGRASGRHIADHGGGLLDGT